MQFTQTRVLETLQTVFDDVFIEKVSLNPQLSAKEVPEWDSLLHITLVMTVEKKFGIRFRVGEVESTQNVGQFADLILKRIQEK